MIVDALCPGLLRVGRRLQELAGGTVQQIVERVAIRHGDHFPLAPAHGGVQQHGDLGGIPIVNVVRGELEVPLQLPRGCVQRHQRAGIQVISRPHVPVPIRPWIAHAPVKKVQLGIIRTGDPRGPAPGLPVIAGPRLVARFPLAGNGPKSPEPLAGFRVVGIDEAADASLAPGDPRDDFSRHRQGRKGNRVPQLVIVHHRLPAHRAGLGVQRHQVGV